MKAYLLKVYLYIISSNYNRSVHLFRLIVLSTINFFMWGYGGKVY